MTPVREKETLPSAEGSRPRLHTIDAFRGLAVVNMVAYHLLYDIFIVWGMEPGWYLRPPVQLWQQGICWSFILVSGFVWQYGGGQLRRGLVCNFWGLVISAVTLFCLPSETIWFGILNFIGCAMILMLPLQKALKRVSPAWGLAICFLLFLLFKEAQYGYLGLSGLFQIPLPQWLYGPKLLTPIGFPYPGFLSSDYFPLIPWMFLYLCGFFFNRIFVEHPQWNPAACRKIPLFSALGRKSIWIYLIHQPLCMLVCIALFSLR